MNYSPVIVMANEKNVKKETNNSDHIWKWFCLSYSVMSVLISAIIHKPAPTFTQYLGHVLNEYAFDQNINLSGNLRLLFCSCIMSNSNLKPDVTFTGQG